MDELITYIRTFLLSRRDLISVEKGHALPKKSRRDVINCVPTARLKRVNSVSSTDMQSLSGQMVRINKLIFNFQLSTFN